MHSKVFVIQDIDGDRSYSLRMDTLLDGDYAREDITRFFDEVTQDVAKADVVVTKELGDEVPRGKELWTSTVCSARSKAIPATSICPSWLCESTA